MFKWAEQKADLQSSVRKGANLLCGLKWLWDTKLICWDIVFICMCTEVEIDCKQHLLPIFKVFVCVCIYVCVPEYVYVWIFCTHARLAVLPILNVCPFDCVHACTQTLCVCGCNCKQQLPHGLLPIFKVCDSVCVCVCVCVWEREREREPVRQPVLNTNYKQREREHSRDKSDSPLPQHCIMDYGGKQS